MASMVRSKGIRNFSVNKKNLKKKFAPFFAVPPKSSILVLEDRFIIIKPKMLGRVENGIKNPHLVKGNCKHALKNNFEKASHPTHLCT